MPRSDPDVRTVLAPGDELAGHRVVRRIGRGSMGNVYEATRTDGTRVALKVLHPKLLTEDKALHRFQREARVGARIDSENVAKTLDAGVTDGRPWLAMELVEGETLDAFMERSAPLPAEVAERLSRQLIAAVAAAHAAGVVHRDLKPDNVFVTRDGQLKIGDFGVAKSMDAATFNSTRAGLGTPMWTAPEQGREGWVPSPRADVWALGLLVYYLYTGKLYWRHAQERSSLAELSVELVRGDIAPASLRASEQGLAERLPSRFDRWFFRAVARDPEQRFADAAEAGRAFGRLYRSRLPLYALAVAGLIVVLVVLLLR